jgi:hypothetical protein
MLRGGDMSLRLAGLASAAIPAYPPGRTTQWSGRPTAQARFFCVALSLWVAAHRGREPSPAGPRS